MFPVAMVAVLITMSLALARAMIGPTVFDRILALNMFGTKTVLLIAVIAFISGRPDFLDLALVYALMNFIGVIAVRVVVASRRALICASRRKVTHSHLFEEPALRLIRGVVGSDLTSRRFVVRQPLLVQL